MYLPKACVGSGSLGRSLSLANAAQIDAFYSSGVIAEFFFGPKMFSKCGD